MHNYISQNAVVLNDFSMAKIPAFVIMLKTENGQTCIGSGYVIKFPYVYVLVNMWTFQVYIFFKVF